MRDTQAVAWKSIKPKLSARRRDVLNAIVVDGSTLFELVDKLGWPINRVSGRLTELAKTGLIIDAGRRRVNPLSGKKGIVWERV